VIVLAAGLWWTRQARAARWVGLAALAAVSVQGVLGIFRIELHAVMGNYLAMIHGAFAQVVITLLVCVAFMTSRSWGAVSPAGSEKLRFWSFITVGLVFVQILLGGLVRHLDFTIGARLHLFVAFAVVMAAFWLAELALEQGIARGAVKLLLGAVALQVALGVESWLAKFANPTSPFRMLEPLPVHADWVRTLHYLTGTLILATAVVIAMRASSAQPARPAIVRSPLEEAA
jgi:heme A synthase